MGFYQDQVVPLLTSSSMRNKNLAAMRGSDGGRKPTIGSSSRLTSSAFDP